ncbi:MAG: type II toxin-antitoxin system Phd/YefM family antitoxin [Propionibacteriales bacterium]|nr:type II toxin-antitoxin system Phd/YefM family antitoxin [Propionibacteriales bacterium]
MTTMSAREFNRDVSSAKRAADNGPVVITDRGMAAYVLLTAADYEDLTEHRTILDWLQVDDDIDFTPPQLRSMPQTADL